MKAIVLLATFFGFVCLNAQIYLGAGYELPYQFKHKKGNDTRQNEFSNGGFIKMGIQYEKNQFEGELSVINWKQNEWSYQNDKKFTSKYQYNWLRLKLRYSRQIIKTETENVCVFLGLSISPSTQGGGSEIGYIGDSLVGNIHNGFATSIYAGSGPLIGVSYGKALNKKKTLKAFGSIGMEYLIENEIFNGNRRYPFYTIRGNVYSAQVGLRYDLFHFK